MSGSQEIRSEAVPFLPGTTFKDPQRMDYRKSHCFDYKNQLPIFKPDAPGIGADELESTKLDKTRRGVPAGEQTADQFLAYRTKPEAGEEFIPSFVAFDRMVLCFFAWNREPIFNSAEEKERVRAFIIYYYLEDDTIEVYERAVNNSGLPQGVFVKRHRVPKADGNFLTLSDLNVGTQIEFYARSYTVYGCNKSTREYLEALNVTVPEDGEAPGDSYIDKRVKQTKAHTEQTARKATGPDKLAKFLEHDRAVLRFYGLWDDRTAMFGETHKLVVHYYLCDDTVEVLEVQQANCGRDPFPVFLKRCEIPSCASSTCECKYRAKDLFVGLDLNVFGRIVKLYDCDSFTRTYLLENGRTEAEVKAIDVDEQGAVHHAAKVATDDGGDSLTPKRPRKDWKKLQKYEDVVLRFAGELVSESPVDQGRRFVITFWPANDTLSIFELPRKNSGIDAGKYLDRTVVENPKTSTVFVVEDFKLGETITVFAREFKLVDSDLFTRTFLEKQ